MLEYGQMKRIEARQTSVPESNARQQLCGKGDAAEGFRVCLHRKYLVRQRRSDELPRISRGEL